MDSLTTRRRSVTILMAHASPTLGMERCALRLAEALKSRYRVNIVVVRGPVPDIEGTETRTLRKTRRRTPWDLIHLARLARRRDTTVIAVGVWIAVPWLMVDRWARRRTIVWEHSLLNERTASSSTALRALSRLAARLYRRAARVVAVSGALADDVSSMCRLDVAVVPNLLPHSTVTVAEPRVGGSVTRRDVLRIATIGSLTNTKRQELVLEALARLPGHFELDVLGDGPNRQRLESHAAQMRLGSRVRFHGHVPQATALHTLAEADVMVHASTSETFGLVYFEAANAGVPVLSARHRVAEALIPEYVPGSIFDDVEGLVALLEDPTSLRRDQGRSVAAREARHARFGSEAVVDEWCTILDAGLSAEKQKASI